jgi:hypothetical protein
MHTIPKIEMSDDPIRWYMYLYPLRYCKSNMRTFDLAAKAWQTHDRHATVRFCSSHLLLVTQTWTDPEHAQAYASRASSEFRHQSL